MTELIKTENKRAVIYCRVSTREQVDDGNSLATQDRTCREYALKNGYDIVNTFIEQGESAKTTHRTELQRLLTYCAQRNNRINAVIAYKIDRISRNTDDYSSIRIALKSKGIEIKSTSEYFENTPAGRFMENIIANVAQFDNDVRTERSVGGMRDAAKEGRYVWMAPVGYDNVKIGGKCTISQNAMAPIILNAFQKVGLNECAIDEAYRLAIKEGMVNRNGKPVARSYFYTMLKNELYTGWIIKFGERYKGLFEPIVTEELFNHVQKVIKNRNRKNYYYLIDNPDFPLKRFITHPSGLKLTGGWSQGRQAKYPYYRFIRKGCNYNKSILELKFQNFINNYCFDIKKLQILKQGIEDHLVSEQRDRQKESEWLKSHISELKAKQSQLIQKNLQGIIANHILQTELDRIDKEIIKAEMTLDKIPQKLFSIKDMTRFISEYLKNPGKVWAIAEPTEKKDLQWFKFPSGVTYDGANFRTTEISCLFNAKNEFLPEKSNAVHSSSEFLNNPEIAYDKNKAPPAIYWEYIGAEIVKLNEILKRVKGYPE